MSRIVLLYAVACFMRHSVLGLGQYSSVLAEQLNQYCESQNRCEGSANSTPRTGKAGPRGPRGPAGMPGTVNYTIVEDAVNRIMGEADLERRLREVTDRVESLQQAAQKHTRKSCIGATRSEAKTWNGTGGVFDIYPGDSERSMEVYCDLTTDGGGWTVFQRRNDGTENFERNWADYVVGFGRKDMEFWLGLEQLHRITSRGSFEMRVDLEDWDGNAYYALYTTFSLGDAVSQYTLSVGGYSGTAGDSLAYHNGHKFYTADKDNGQSCSTKYRGAWWYNNCYYSNLNGLYIRGGSYKASVSYGTEWWHLKNAHYYSLKSVSMKIRPKY